MQVENAGCVASRYLNLPKVLCLIALDDAVETAAAGRDEGISAAVVMGDGGTGKDPYPAGVVMALASKGNPSASDVSGA